MGRSSTHRRGGGLVIAALAAAACVPGGHPPVAPVAAPTTAPAPSPTPDLSPEAAVYLGEALDFIQANSVKASQVDWPVYRRSMLVQAAGARTPADTYPTLRYAVRLLGDRHSTFLDPVQAQRYGDGTALGTGVALVGRVVAEVAPAGPADLAGVRAGDVLEAVNGQPVGQTPTEAQRATVIGAPVSGGTPGVRVTLRRRGHDAPVETTFAPALIGANRPPSGQRLAGGLGYLELPAEACAGAACESYAGAAQAALQRVDEDGAGPICGWVVDLRRNRGGNLWPMLVGAGPLLGEGEVGAYVKPGPDGQRLAWRLRAEDGAALLDNTAQGRPRGLPYRLRRPEAPVAVLTSRVTASAGEHMIVAFRGRPETRTFGEPTAGLPTANLSRMLPDGARIIVTAALVADRTGQTYDQVIPPDESVATDWTRIEDRSEADPPLAAALAWLRTAPCPPAA